MSEESIRSSTCSFVLFMYFSQCQLNENSLRHYKNITFNMQYVLPCLHFSLLNWYKYRAVTSKISVTDVRL